jgi:hypothetical protein
VREGGRKGKSGARATWAGETSLGRAEERKEERKERPPGLGRAGEKREPAGLGRKEKKKEKKEKKKWAGPN